MSLIGKLMDLCEIGHIDAVAFYSRSAMAFNGYSIHYWTTKYAGNYRTSKRT